MIGDFFLSISENELHYQCHKFTDLIRNNGESDIFHLTYYIHYRSNV